MNEFGKSNFNSFEEFFQAIPQKEFITDYVKNLLEIAWNEGHDCGYLFFSEASEESEK
jgi:hypothetical protein